MKKITTSSIQALLQGASLLACGGGLTYTEQLRLTRAPLLRAALKKGIVLLDARDLSDDAICVTVSEVGAAGAPPMQRTALPEALQEWQRQTGKVVSAIIPGEVGQETIVLEAAATLGLPVVDADLAGCRAVPRLSYMALVVKGKSFTMSPLVVVTEAGEVTFLPQQSSLELDEQKVRALVPEGQVITLLGGCVTGAQIKADLNYHSYSLALHLGKVLRTGKSISTLLPTAVLLSPLEGVVEQSTLGEAAGFDQKVIQIRTKLGVAEVVIENEFMQLTLNSSVYSFPQLIMMYDVRQQRGLHSSEVEVGKKVTLLVADAFEFWKHSPDNGTKN